MRIGLWRFLLHREGANPSSAVIQAHFSGREIRVAARSRVADTKRVIDVAT